MNDSHRSASRSRSLNREIHHLTFALRCSRSLQANPDRTAEAEPPVGLFAVRSRASRRSSNRRFSRRPNFLLPPDFRLVIFHRGLRRVLIQPPPHFHAASLPVLLSRRDLHPLFNQHFTRTCDRHSSFNPVRHVPGGRLPRSTRNPKVTLTMPSHQPSQTASFHW